MAYHDIISHWSELSKKEPEKKKVKYPKHCCQKCGKPIGWLGKVLEIITFKLVHHDCTFERAKKLFNNTKKVEEINETCEGYEHSNCCEALIKHSDICSECGEHCDTMCSDCNLKDTCPNKKNIEDLI